jgi:hypothetical protein
MDSDESSAGIRIVSRSNDDDLYSPRLRRQSSGIDITQIPRRRRQSQNLPRHTDHNFFRICMANISSLKLKYG